MKTFFIVLLISTNAMAVNIDKLTSIAFSKSCNTQNIVNLLPSSLEDRINNIDKAITSISLSIPVNPCLLLSITWTETNFKALQKSNKGAKGLMQILPSTRKEVITKMGDNLNKMITLNLNTNVSGRELEDISVGAYYMNWLLTKFQNNEDHAIMAYNMGPKWLNNKLNHKQMVGHKNLYLTKVKNNLILVANN